jgi:hypothetical protein
MHTQTDINFDFLSAGRVYYFFAPTRICNVVLASRPSVVYWGSWGSLIHWKPMAFREKQPARDDQSL